MILFQTKTNKANYSGKRLPLLKIITSENVAFEAHSKIFFLIISSKSHALFFRYSIFYIPTALKDVMSLRVLTHDV